MCRNITLLVLGLLAALAIVNLDRNAVAAEYDGITLEGFNANSIVRLNDGSLITPSGEQSTDGGRTWTQHPFYQTLVGGIGLLRLPNGQLGGFEGTGTLEQALGNDTNNWYFRWSTTEGISWSYPVQVTLPGLTMGLSGTGMALQDGSRIMLFTYSQFIGSGFDQRGSSVGNYRGVDFAVETEGHFPVSEAGRAYYSDDNGRTWNPNDGWIMGWQEEAKVTDAFTEPSGVELDDGRIMMVGRTLTGRLYQAFSEDRGESWWPGAQPMELASSYSPARISRLPGTGDLLAVWNQVSREEIRKGLRRGRLSCAISKDNGQTWEHFKNLEAMESLAQTTRITPDADLSPVVGDDYVGRVPDDYSLFHYPNISVVDNEVFIGYFVSGVRLGTDPQGEPIVVDTGGQRTRILPVDWFYRDPPQIMENFGVGYTTNGQILNSPWIDARGDVYQHNPIGATTTAACSGSWSASTTGQGEDGYLRGVASKPTDAGPNDTDVVATAAIRMDNGNNYAYSRLALSPFAMASGDEGWAASERPGSLEVDVMNYESADDRFILWYVRTDGTRVRQDYAVAGLDVTQWLEVRLSMPYASGGDQSASLEWKLAAADSWDMLGSIALDDSFSATNLGIGFTHTDPGNCVWMDDITFFSVSNLAWLLGDANQDGLVSADDFASVQANFGNTGAADGSLLGDANHDGVVSADDYATVQANFGNTSGSGTSEVPEPATLGLLLIGGLLAVLCRRK